MTLKRLSLRGINNREVNPEMKKKKVASVKTENNCIMIKMCQILIPIIPRKVGKTMGRVDLQKAAADQSQG